MPVSTPASNSMAIPRGYRRTPSAVAVAVIGAMIAPILGLAPTVAQAAPTPATDRSAVAGFEIPDGALVRPLGEVVPGGCENLVFPGCNPALAGFMPYTTPGLGVPLGGIGAGSFMINQSGTFGPWYFGGSQSTSYEVRALPQAAFHVREKVGDAPSRLRTLATEGPKDETLPSVRSWDDPLSGWATLDPGQADYAALYPFGWMDYDEDVFATDVAMRFYSPIVAGDEESSSLPVAYFDVQITNDTDEAADVSTMFTMPNVGGHVGRTPATVRDGLSSRYREDPSTGIRAVTLSADAESNSPDAYRSEWTIAAAVDEGQTFSYVQSWDATGDGSDVYEQFGDDGRLSDTALDASASAGAIAVSAQLEPGEQVTIPFALTWDFPQVAFADNNTVWMRRYTEFYGAQTTATNDYVPGSYPFHQSFAIAKDALARREDALDDVLAWWEPVVNSETVPTAVGAAAVNQLANVTFHTNLWENGLVRNSVPVTKGGDRIGTAVPDTHNYFGTDANSGGVSTLGQGGEIGIYSHNVYSELLPFIERDRMRAKVEQILTSDDGDPGDFDVIGSTDPAVYALGGNPFVTWNPHNQSSNNPAPGAGLPPAPGTMSFLDRAAANIYRMYDYAQRNDDDEFLAFAYPAMNRVLGMLRATVPEGAQLPEPTSRSNPQPGNVQQMANVYNAMPTDRFDAYTSGFYLLALESMIAAGGRVGEDAEQIEVWEEELRQAKRAYTEVFWNESRGYFRYTLAQSDVDTVMLATMLPQLLAEQAGLRDLVDMDLYKRHLRSMYPLVASPNGPKLLGLAPGASGYPLVGSQGLVYEPNVVPGAAFSAAATYVAAARRFDDSGLRDAGMQLAQSTIAQLWSTPAHGYEFNTPYLYGSANPERWVYPSFENNLAVWQLVDELRTTSVEPEPEPVPRPQLSLSASQVRTGDAMLISATGFSTGAAVELVVNSEPVVIGTVKAGDDGRFSISWTVPVSIAPGAHRVVASTQDGARASADFTVIGASEGGAVVGSNGGESASVRDAADPQEDLANTGADAVGMVIAVAAGLCLLTLGATLRIRRRTGRHVDLGNV
jgi:non-lysosomal glucosylceramidase